MCAAANTFHRSVSYVPAIGRFTSTDPVEGGAATDYDYSFQDPVNKEDLPGTLGIWRADRRHTLFLGVTKNVVVTNQINYSRCKRATRCPRTQWAIGLQSPHRHVAIPGTVNATASLFKGARRIRGYHYANTTSVGGIYSTRLTVHSPRSRSIPSVLRLRGSSMRLDSW